MHSIKSESQFGKVIYQQVKKKILENICILHNERISMDEKKHFFFINKKYAHKMSHAPANSLHISCPPVHLRKIEKWCWKL